VEPKHLIFFEGGGWCYGADSEHKPATSNRIRQDCWKRSRYRLGSSTSWERGLRKSWMTGYLSEDPKENKVFSRWTLIYVPYCDGVGFAGNRSMYGLHFRGQAIREAVIQQAIKMGIRSSQMVVLSGGSAGAALVLQKADMMAEELRLYHGRVLALPDAGFFVDIPDKSGKRLWQNNLKFLYEQTHACSNLHSSCVQLNPRDPCSCLFPENYVDFVKTPTFLVQSLYDYGTAWFTLGLLCCPGDLCKGWPTCRGADMRMFHALRTTHMHRWAQFVRNAGNGIWAISCMEHTLAWSHFSSSAWKVARGGRGYTMAQAVLQWLRYHEGNHSVESDRSQNSTLVWEDKAWPHNPGCAYQRLS